jgi:long-chain acyl-CoA synthetase
MAQLSLEEATRLLTAPGMPFEIEEVEIRGRLTRTWKHAPRTLRALTERMREHGDRTYLVYEDERLSFAEAYSRVAGLAHTLVGRCGIERGDRVAIAMRNYPEWPVAFWAAASVGAIVVPLNAWWKGDELEYGLADSGAQVLVADAERAALLEPHYSSLDLRDVFVVRAEAALANGLTPFDEALDPSGPDSALPDAEVDPDDDATIFYTSGTTGRPKGALGTHRNLCTNVASSMFGPARALARRGEVPPPPGAPREPGVSLISIPFFHVTGSHSILATATWNGDKLVMMYRWNPERALELIERERIHSFGGVPSMAWQVIESSDFEKRDTSSVVRVAYGGAPAAPDLVRRILERFPQARPGQGYGMTETSAIATSNHGEDYVRQPDSIGPPVPVCDVKVIGPDGETLPSGEVGELCMRGPNIVRGYWGKPEATAETFRDGWCHSGDIARIDEEGLVYLVDRAKDMLIRGGENVYCVEVEDALYAHADVMDAAVVGIPDRVLGEEVGAVVQVTQSSRVTEAELRAHVAERLARFKVPVKIDLRREPLPRNASGKILKSVLREEITAP